MTAWIKAISSRPRLYAGTLTRTTDEYAAMSADELGISEDDVIKRIMLKDTVDGQFTTTDDVADAVLFFAGARSNALTGQSMVVSHGWFMQ